MELTVKLQVFEGPLDLLLYLLEKNKVNIYDIPIVEITEQYMEYIREMKRQDLEVLSEFLVMAATLIDIKSRMLLPSNPDSEEEEEDPRAELVQQLLEYKMYKCMAYELKDRQMDAGRVMYKKPTIPEEVRAYEPPVDIHELISDITLSRLHEIFESIMKNSRIKLILCGQNSERLKRRGIAGRQDGGFEKICGRTQTFQFPGTFDGTVIESGSDRYVSCDSGADENGNDTDFAGTYF